MAYKPAAHVWSWDRALQGKPTCGRASRPALFEVDRATVEAMLANDELQRGRGKFMAKKQRNQLVPNRQGG